jgi:glycolate oxidase
MLEKKSFKKKDELITHIQTHSPTFYYSSQTSTVIPYDKLEELFKDDSFCLADLSQLPSSVELLPNNNLLVKGPINWKDAKEYLNSNGRNILTAPTEELALITAGAATSCTGERCFSFGNLRSQIESITYLNYKGEEIKLNKDSPFEYSSESLSAYQNDFKTYEDFKNAPYPRFEFAIDILIGTEGQLGVITEIEIKTVADFNVNHLFMLLPKWEENLDSHMEIIEKIQGFRENVILCEHIDSNSFNYLPESDRPNQGQDAIFFEIKSDYFEEFYENFLLTLSFLDEDKIFELSAGKFHQLRASIPRAVFEENSKMGVTKMGTDVQVKVEDFRALMSIYQEFSKLGLRYNLFGHFGDAHLHFNFMPTTDQTQICKEQLESLYKKVLELKGSPFAEHGIGIIKQKFITRFWGQNQFNTFKELKHEYDPHNQFFPQGFMNLKE